MFLGRRYQQMRRRIDTVATGICRAKTEKHHRYIRCPFRRYPASFSRTPSILRKLKGDHGYGILPCIGMTASIFLPLFEADTTIGLSSPTALVVASMIFHQFGLAAAFSASATLT